MRAERHACLARFEQLGPIDPRFAKRTPQVTSEGVGVTRLREHERVGRCVARSDFLERFGYYFESGGKIHVQTWHGFRDRIEAAMRRRRR